MQSLKNKLFEHSNQIAQHLGALTPNILLNFNLKYILDYYGQKFKPNFRPDNILGQRRFFWEYFHLNFIEWNKYSNAGYIYPSIQHNELPHLFSQIKSKKRYGNWNFEIQTINNVSNSKSNLISLNSLDEMVIQNSQDLISDISFCGLQKNMNHNESRIFHSANENVSYEAWNNIFTWHNDGGSHHFAAARYIAKQLSFPIYLTSTLEIYSLDIDIIHTIFSKYDVFLLSGRDAQLYNLLRTNLYNSKVTFITAPIEQYYSAMDKDHGTLKIFAFYKQDKRAKRIIEIFDQSGCLNLKTYFDELIFRQNQFETQSLNLL